MEKINYEATTIRILDSVESVALKCNLSDMLARAQVYATLAVAQALKEKV